jgi:hypothetical protein
MKLHQYLLGACLMAAAATGFAAKGEFGDLCATGLAMGKEVATDCSINMAVGDKTYCFSGEKPKEMFMADQANMTMKAEETFKKMKK